MRWRGDGLGFVGAAFDVLALPSAFLWGVRDEPRRDRRRDGRDAEVGLHVLRAADAVYGVSEAGVMLYFTMPVSSLAIFVARNSDGTAKNMITMLPCVLAPLSDRRAEPAPSRRLGGRWRR